MPKRSRILSLICIVIPLVLGAKKAQALALPSVFASGMVLQRDKPIPIWGTAQPNSEVRVSFGGQSVKTTTKPDGTWLLTLQPMLASDIGQTMTVEGDGTHLDFKDVLIGEVWLCSGQSNMQLSTKYVNNADEEMAQATDRAIRLCTVARSAAPEPQSNANIKWDVCTPQTVKEFSAVGYFFARNLRKKLHVPIGVIKASWSGTSAEAWTSIPTVLAHRQLTSALPLWEKVASTYPQRLEKWEKQQEETLTQRAKWLVANSGQNEKKAAKKFPLRPKPLEPSKDPVVCGVLYNAMIHPLAPLGIRGVIWYQGEANSRRAEVYRALLPLMIQDWRRLWNASALPFGIVQLANYRNASDTPTDTDWARLRDAQRFVSQTVPYTGLVVTIDIGDAANIHPKNKQTVGQRLAFWALHEIYANNDIPYRGPVYSGFQVVDNRITITFSHVAGQLRTADCEAPAEFIICGSDKNWVWAQVKISGKCSLDVWSDKIDKPVAVRYAWSDNPKNPNLTDDSQLPASPFRTDNWLRQK